MEVVVVITGAGGLRHILYRQQHEQVKHKMTVTTNITKIVIPTAMNVPKLAVFTEHMN